MSHIRKKTNKNGTINPIGLDETSSKDAKQPPPPPKKNNGPSWSFYVLTLFFMVTIEVNSFSRWYFCFHFGPASDGRQRVQLADVVLLPLVPHLMARLHHGLHDHLSHQLTSGSSVWPGQNIGRVKMDKKSKEKNSMNA